jgi:hypothetical protein
MCDAHQAAMGQIVHVIKHNLLVQQAYTLHSVRKT